MGDNLTPSGYRGLAGFHKYWGKKPVESWRFLIQRFTNEKDVVLDPFLGSGLIAKECMDSQRRFVGFDVNPVSIELSKLFINLPTHTELLAAFNDVSRNVRDPVRALYALKDGRVLSHLLWNGSEIEKAWIKPKNKRHEIVLTSDEILGFQHAEGYQPKYVRDIRLFDNARINSKRCFSWNDLFSPRALLSIDLLKEQIEKYNGNTHRALLLVLSASLGQMSNMVFAVSKRHKTKGRAIDRIETGSWVIGYWRPQQHFEVNAWNCFENKAHKLLKAIWSVREPKCHELASSFEEFQCGNLNACIQVGDSERLLDDIPPDTFQVILTDPPHGDRIPYLELSEVWNSVLDLDVNYDDELVVSNAIQRKKGTGEYSHKLSAILAQCDRVLCRGGLMAVMFNARSRDHWNSLCRLEHNTDLSYLGYYPMAYSAHSVVQDNREGGLKRDYVLLYQKGVLKAHKARCSSILHTVPDFSPLHPMMD